MIDSERDGFFVELTFVKTFGQGSRPAKKNPGKMAWEKMAKTKRCVVQIKNNDDLCLSRAIVNMKERCDGGSQYQNLRKENAFKNVWLGCYIKKRVFQRAPVGSKNFKHFKTI